MSTATKLNNGQVELITGSEEFGKSFVSVLVKRSFTIVDGKATRSEQDSKLRISDVYFDDGDPQSATIQHESELTPNKLGTDVVLIGNVYAPQRKPTHQMSVEVSVAGKSKSLRVIGNRFALHVPNGCPRFSEPAPFTEMELRYENAYGGKDDQSDKSLPFWYPRNDKGKGVVLGDTREVVEGLSLPNIESKDDLLTPERLVIGDPRRWPQQPLPQGFGWRQKTWFPRCALIGACPPFLDVGVVTVEERLGLLPKDYVSLARQFRLAPNLSSFGNGASLGMTFPFLQGNEPIKINGLTPDGLMEFALPGEFPDISIDTGKGQEGLQARLFSVSISPDQGSMDMIWAGIKEIGDYRNWSTVKTLVPEVH